MVHEPLAADVPDGPLPVCDLTSDSEEPCEEPAVARRWSGWAVFAAATLGALAGGTLVAAAALFVFGLLPWVRPVSEVKAPERPAPIVIEPDGESDRAVAVAAKVTPAVVNVTVQQVARDPFTGARVFRAAGNGSGVVLTEDGHILTNAHVVDGASNVLVKIGVEDVEATLVGVDRSSDLAVIKVDRTSLPVAELGTSSGLQVGQFVVAIGSPFGLEKTVTTGIISALQRTNLAEGPEDLTRYTNLIQTDAAINPGNSGGALADAEGRVIGINTLIQSPTGAYGAPQSAGIGFAIPIDFARDVAEQLIAKGFAEHPFMGVQTTTVDQATATRYGLGVDRGALVLFVVPGSPAESAGVEAGDILVRIADRDIGSGEDVFGAVRSRRVGDEIEVVVVRSDTQRTLRLVLGSDAAPRP